MTSPGPISGWCGAAALSPPAAMVGARPCGPALNTLVFPLMLVGATTVVLLLAVQFSPFEFNSILYLLPVMISAIRWGVAPAMVAALASVAVSDFFFLPPLYSFVLNEPSDAVDLALFLFVAVVTGNLAARLQREADSSHRREHEIHHLYLLSRRLALCSTASDLVAAIQEYLTSHLGCQAFLIQPPQESCRKRYAGRQSLHVHAPARGSGRNSRRRRTALAPGVRSGSSDNLWALKSIATQTTDHGVLAVNLGHHSPRETSQLNDRIEAILSEAAATLMRIDAVTAFANANLAPAVRFSQDRADRQRVPSIALADRVDIGLDQRARRHPRIARRPAHSFAGRRHAPGSQTPGQRHPEPSRYRANHRHRHQAGAGVDRPGRRDHCGDPATLPSPGRAPARGRYGRRAAAAEARLRPGRAGGRAGHRECRQIFPGRLHDLDRGQGRRRGIDHRGHRSRNGPHAGRGRRDVQAGVSRPPAARGDPGPRPWPVDCKDIRRCERGVDRGAKSRPGTRNHRDHSLSGSMRTPPP